MNTDKKRMYVLSTIIFAVLLVILFINVSSSKIITAILLVPLTALTCILISKRVSVSINKKEVLLISLVSSAIFIVLKEMTGLYFGFYENPYFVNTEWLVKYILPSAIIIIATEIIRFIWLSQKNKYASFIIYLSCVLAEILMFSNIAGITSFNRFMDAVGMTLFPAISANIYYHYISKRYGMLPNIAFRLITTLYFYFLPTTTAMNDALNACIGIIFPIVMMSLMSAMFEKKKKNAIRKGKKMGWISTTLTIAVIVSTAMLISCQFRFGALVIATESMTGEINKGDMIIYERYEDQSIKEGQVIVFLQDKSKIVHRVMRIENIGGETRYYTKGDANPTDDPGYRTEEDIFGLTDIKVAYIGYPTLWLRSLFEAGNQN